MKFLKNIKSVLMIYCFGDDYNDIGMFKFCKNAVAMGNAISELKTIAKFVTETNDNDGVAKFLVEKGIITYPLDST